MQHSRIGRIAAVTAASVGLAVGAAGVAGAVGHHDRITHTTATTNTSANAADRGKHEVETPDNEKPEFTSSIRDNAKSSAHDESDATEQARLMTLATIKPDQAKMVALSAQPGTLTKLELNSDDGNVVYEATISTSGSKSTTVIIDPGNAKVLHIEHETDQEAGDADAHDEEPDAGSHRSVTTPSASVAPSSSQPGSGVTTR